MLSAWRGFFRYLARDHGYAVNPALGIRAPKSAKKLPHALSPDEAARLMEIGETTTLAVRDKAMLELFYSSGLRLSELTGARSRRRQPPRRNGPRHRQGRQDAHRAGRKPRARGDREPGCAQRDSLARGAETALFVGKGGRRLSPRAVQARLKHWALRLGLAANVHPHVLRHSFASHVLQSSGDLRAVQEMLGHASISTTQVYTHLDFQHLAKAYDAAHPRARRKA